MLFVKPKQKRVIRGDTYKFKTKMCDPDLHIQILYRHGNNVKNLFPLELVFNIFNFLQEFKEFCPNEQFVKGTLCLDICAWDPSYSKTQVRFYPV